MTRRLESPLVRQTAPSARVAPSLALVRQATRAAVVCLTIGLVPASGSAQVQRVTIQLPGYGAPILLDTVGTWRDVPFRPDSVYRVLRSVYADMMIPANFVDSSGMYVGTTDFKKTRRLAGRAMSQLVECGSGMTGPRADSYRIHFAIVSRVEPTAAQQARIRTAVVAAGEDISGPSTSPIPCGSTGSLEVRIHDLVIQRLRAR